MHIRNAKEFKEKSSSLKRAFEKNKKEEFDFIDNILINMRNRDLLKKEMKKILNKEIPENLKDIVKKGKNYVCILLRIKEGDPIKEKNKLLFFYNGELVEYKVNPSLSNSIEKIRELSNSFVIKLSNGKELYYEKFLNRIKEKKY